jgi:hypothetical protein
MTPISPAKCLSLRPDPAVSTSCEHRTVSKDGRIICTKITEGDNTASPNTCRNCPFQAVDCSHLRFSLRLSSPSPLIVRFNGRTEIWDDHPPQLRFQQAACAARVIPIERPDACAACPLRQPIANHPAARPTRQPAARSGKVVPFPLPESAAAAG